MKYPNWLKRTKKADYYVLRSKIEHDIWIAAYKQSLKRSSIDRSEASAHDAVNRYRKWAGAHLSGEAQDELSQIYEDFQEFFSERRNSHLIS